MADGISKGMFVVGLVIAIVASSSLSMALSSQLSFGPKGDKGDTGPQGIQGIQGLKGDEGDRGPQGPARPATTFAQWHLTWMNMTATGDWDSEIGTSIWGAVFDHDYGTGVLFGGYNNLVGFRAYMWINMTRDGPVHFVIGSDDGSSLYVDSVLRISNWGAHSYREVGVTMDLSKGLHELKLDYYDVDHNARISFDCDLDLMLWNP